MRRPFLLAALVAAVGVASAPTRVQAIDGTCRALAMSGGGDKAAYEAGVIAGLLQNLPASETSYDVVTGISAGSTLTAAFSVFDIGQEQQVADFAYSIIKDLNQSAIFRMWPGGLVQGLLQEASIFDSTPLRDLFTSVLADKTLSTDRVTCMGATELNSGAFVRFCEHESLEAVVNATISSAAIPGVFLDQTWGPGMNTYVDGGTLVNVDVIGAVEQCLNLGYAQQDIIVDTIECSGKNFSALAGDLSTLTTLPILLRAAALNSFAKKERDYSAAQHAYPGVHFRYRIHPSVPISGSGIDFNRTQMIEMEALGEADAKNAVDQEKKRAAEAKRPIANKITLSE